MNTAPLTAALGQLRSEAGPRDPARSDRQLLDAYTTANDPTAFAALVKRHGPMVLGVCHRVLRQEQDAEDAFQAAFLVLARKAASIRSSEALPSWLHGVSYRMALRAKRDAGRRRKHESQVEPRPSPPAWEVGWGELQAVLDEEVKRLPPADGAAFVLCCLEGLSGPEAAARLGVKANTIFSRLARARKRLQRRLARRGISLAALLAAAAAGPAAVPPRLWRQVCNLPIESAGYKPAATGPITGLSARVLALAEGVTPTMLTNKTTLGTVLLVALCVLGTGLAVWARPVIRKPSEQTAPQKSAPPAPKPDGKALEVGGRVLGPDGKPVKGAKVYLLDDTIPSLPGAVRASGDADGRFHFRVARTDFVGSIMRVAQPWDCATVVAVADGYGIGLPTEHGLSTGLTLRLVKEAPLTGRIIDLQGKPVAGITVRAHGVYGPPKGDLSAFLAGVRKGQEFYPSRGQLVGFHLAGPGRTTGLLPAATVTGADGRFTIKGIGRERLVHLRIEGPTITTRDVYAMTRPGDTVRVPGYRRYLPRTDLLTLYGDGFDHVAAPGQVITGVVRDKDTGKPIPGAIVTSYKRAGSHISAVTDLQAVADKDGRYRLLGMPKGQGNVIRAGPPSGEPYLLSIRKVADTPELKPVEVDFTLKRGVWLRGRVLDQRTRRPLHAAVEYLVFADNPHRREAPGLAVEIYLQSNPRDGTFRTVALPGRGLVAARAWNDRYRSRLGADKIKGLGPDGHFNTEPHLLHASGFHRLVEINPAADAREVTCDLLLDSGTTLTGTVQDPDGKPLVGVRVNGLRTYGGSGSWESPLPGSDFVVTGLAEGEKRLLQFIHPDKKLAGHLLLKGNEKGPLTVRLEAAATLTGRLVTPQGDPVSGGRLISPLSAVDGQLWADVRPSKDGKFHIEGLVPGLTYRLGLSRANYFHQLGGAAAGGLVLKPGETKDLGDVVVKLIK